MTIQVDISHTSFSTTDYEFVFSGRTPLLPHCSLTMLMAQALLLPYQIHFVAIVVNVCTRHHRPICLSQPVDRTSTTSITVTLRVP